MKQVSVMTSNCLQPQFVSTEKNQANLLFSFSNSSLFPTHTMKAGAGAPYEHRVRLNLFIQQIIASLGFEQIPSIATKLSWVGTLLMTSLMVVIIFSSMF